MGASFELLMYAWLAGPVWWGLCGKSYHIARPDSHFTTTVAPKALQGCKVSRES